MIRNTTLIITLICFGVSAASAQNYYPADIGNTWVLESQDGTERATYTLEIPDEDVSSENFRTLKIVTEAIGTTSIETNTFLVEIGEDGMKLHKLVAELGDLFSGQCVWNSHRLPSFSHRRSNSERRGKCSEKRMSILGRQRHSLQL